MVDPQQLRREDLTYNDYLQVPDLLSLQQPHSTPTHHDEMLFIIIHQAYELWFKLVLHEIEQTIEFMREDRVLRARHFLHRCVQIMRLLVQQIHIIETMAPVEFLGFRDHLNPASGFQSVQFREVEFLAGLKDPRYMRFFTDRPEIIAKLQARLDGPDLRLEIYDLLRRRGFVVPEDCRLDSLKEHPKDRAQLLSVLREVHVRCEEESILPVFLLLESCIEFDEFLSLWREHHVYAVERIIGRKRGTGGSSGVSYLKKTTARRLFPYLWEVRTVLGHPPTSPETSED